ncbi:MAG: hypothetical protein D4R79_05310 [Comamonadaceae bacterium]|nr:MAG: hypothetical protein D4R79_05310 [Comamonadaceae bacterium]
MANELSNAGFETDAFLNDPPVPFATDWTTFNGAKTASSPSDPTRSGIGSLQLAGGGGFSVPGAYQTLPAVPGQLWDFQGYMLATNTLPATITFGLLKIVWSDGVNDLAPGTVNIGTPNFANPGIESTPLLNSSSTPNVWQFTRAQGIAPAGTTQVKLYALMVDQNAGTGYFDDLQATNFGASPLSASITSPANLATVGADFTINAAASVLPGAITNVYFYDGVALLGNDDTAPYAFAVTGASDGSHTLKVVAKGTNGVGSSISVTSSVVTVTVSSTATVYVDPSKAWLGFINVSETPLNGSGYVFGSSWAIPDLRASWSGSTLTLSPNTIGDPAAFWYVTTNTPSVGNKIIEANMYVEPAGSLPGVTVTFTGTCISDTLTSLANTNPDGNGWTCIAVIKDFAPNYSSSVVATVPVTNGMRFSVSLATINDPARHVQYGFQTVGPCVWAADTALPGYGNVVIAPGPAVVITPSVSGANLNLSFPSITGYSYTAQYKNNLTDANWTNLAVATNGTGSAIVLTDTHTLPKRFYRVSVQ